MRLNMVLRSLGMYCKLLFSWLIALVLMEMQVLAQEHTIDSKGTDYRRALELYDHRMFADAAFLFEKVSQSIEESATTNLAEDRLTTERINAAIYGALCELRLGNAGAEQTLLSLIRAYPYTPLAAQGNIQLGFYHFTKSDYRRAVDYLQRSDSRSSDPVLANEREFKLAYSLFQLDRTSDADELFNKLKTQKGPYQEDALYYSAHISYEKKAYNKALADLEKINASSPYAEILPVYASQIYLLNGDLIKARKVADSAIKAGNKYTPLLAKVLGSVDFFESKFPDAVKEFGLFKQSVYSGLETNQDIYQIGYSYYKVGSYDLAIKELGQLYDKQDVYAQSGLYTLGQSYLQKKQIQDARSAFQLASALGGNSEINENSLVYYAKLSYEAGLDQDALAASKMYIKNYPKSADVPEVKTLEANILLHAHNYGEAYETLKSLTLNDRAERTFQKVTYFYGLEKYSDNSIPEALGLLNESLSHPIDPEFSSLGLFWKAECQYNLKEYSTAASTYEKFINGPSADHTGLTGDALYGAAYAYFKSNNYQAALNNFERYSALGSKDQGFKSDVEQRMADCYFMLRNYTRAKSLYLAGTSSHTAGADYALFQTAIIQGLQKDQRGKIIGLQRVLSEYPSSTYAADAQYELASTDFVAGRTTSAKVEFHDLINRYPTSTTIPKALLNLGLIAYNAGDDATALDLNKQVVSKYPGSPESRNALGAIRNIYVEKGTPELFITYANQSGLTKLSQTSQDSITYQSASTKYLNRDLKGSVLAFNSYLQNFPNGYFASDAHYFRSQALVRQKLPEEALSDYQYLMTKSTNNAYTETAISQAATLYVSRGECETAVPLLRQLESKAREKQNTALARGDLASCYFKLGKTDSAQFYASSLIAAKDAPPQETSLAQLISAKCFLATGDTASAIKPLAQASKMRNVYSAEARYLSALIAYKKHNYKASMNVIFELSKQLASYDYWVAKSFVLLADNYRAQKDLFQARSTLLSIVKNYRKDDDVRTEAEQKLTTLESARP